MEQVSANTKKYLSRNPMKRLLIHRFEEALVEMLLARAPESILDVGCGEGFLLRSFRDLVSTHLEITEMRLPLPWTIVAGVC